MFSVALFLIHLATASMMYSGPPFKIYDPDVNSLFYINDHTFILGTKWHIIGITHTNPAEPAYEVNLGHAESTLTTLKNSTQYFQHQPFVLGAKNPETHLWAPHIMDVTDYGYTCYNQTNTMQHKRCYIMVYCAGPSGNNSQIRAAYSTDLYEWTRMGTLFIDGVNSRDPMLFYDEQTKLWHLYYVATRPNDPKSNTVNHVNMMRQSNNLFDINSWSTTPYLVFTQGASGSPGGGSTESPFVIRRGINYYLCNGPWYNYTTTRCWYSNNSLNFGSLLDKTSIEAGSFGNLHAAEIVRDSDGIWYISGCGWNQGGVYLSELFFNDNQDNASTSMNIPIPIKVPNKLAFDTNLDIIYPDESYWNVLPAFSDKIFGGNAMNNTFLLTADWSGNFQQNWQCIVVFKLQSSDGNPAQSNYNKQLIKDGSAAAIVFGVNDNDNVNNIISSALGVNVFLNNHLNNGGGIKFFKFEPYNEYVSENVPDLDNDIWYELMIEFNQYESQNKYLNVYLNGTLIINFYEIPFDDSLINGYVGLNVWQGAATFKQFKCD
eukprot:431762_1